MDCHLTTIIHISVNLTGIWLASYCIRLQFQSQFWQLNRIRDIVAWARFGCQLPVQSTITKAIWRAFDLDLNVNWMLPSAASADNQHTSIKLLWWAYVQSSSNRLKLSIHKCDIWELHMHKCIFLHNHFSECSWHFYGISRRC